MACSFANQMIGVSNGATIPLNNVQCTPTHSTAQLLSLLQLVQQQQVLKNAHIPSPCASRSLLPTVTEPGTIARQPSSTFAPVPSCSEPFSLQGLFQKTPAPLTQQPSFSNLGMSSTLELNNTLELAKSLLSSKAMSPTLTPSAPSLSISPLTSNTCAPAEEQAAPTQDLDVLEGSAFASASPSNAEDSKKSRYWKEDEHERFLQAVRIFGAYDHKAIAKYVETRTPGQVRSHSQKFFKKLESFDGHGLPSMARKTYKKRAKKADASDHSGSASPKAQ